MHLPILPLLLFAASAVPAQQAEPRPATPPEAPGHRVATATHDADFGVDGARLTLLEPAAPSLTLRLMDVAGRAVAPDAAPVVDGDVVDYEHGAVVERYRITPGGFEQQFVVRERPAAARDLVFGIAVTGNLECEPRAAAHQVLAFRGDGAPITYGAATAIDANGASAEVATRYDGAGRIELIVPAAFVTAAAFPLLVDPVVGGVFAPGGTTTDDTDPDVAYDPTLRRHLVVWQRAGQVWGRIYGADGAAVIPAVPLTNGAEPAVTWTDSTGTSQFLVVFHHYGRVQGIWVDSASGAASGQFYISQMPFAGHPSYPYYLPSEPDSAPCVSAGDGCVVVGWTRDNNPGLELQARGVFYGTNGWQNGVIGSFATASSGELGPLRLPQYLVAEASILLGRSYVTRAVWEAPKSSSQVGDRDVSTASFRVRSSSVLGLQLFGFIQSPTTLAGTSFAEVRPSIAARAERDENATTREFLVAWEVSGVVRAQRMDLNGTLGSPQWVADGYAPAVAAGTTDYTVVYQNADGVTSSPTAIEAARLLADGTVAIADRPVVSGISEQGEAMVSSWAFPPLQGVFAGNTSLITWHGHTGPIGGVDDVLARFFEPVRPYATVLFGGCVSSTGSLPTLGAVGGEPVPGNHGFAVTLVNAPPLSLAALLIGPGTLPTPLPGTASCTLQVMAPFLLIAPTLTDASGAAQVGIPMPCPIPVGTRLTMQWGIHSPGYNPLGWTVSTARQYDWSQL